MIVQLHKKGSKLECQNYWGISLLMQCPRESVCKSAELQSEDTNQWPNYGVAQRVQRGKKLTKSLL